MSGSTVEGMSGEGEAFPRPVGLGVAVGSPALIYPLGGVDQREWLASAVKAATQTLADQTNRSHKGIQVTLDVTVVPGTDTVTLSIQRKDPTSGKYSTILAAAARVATGTDVLTVYPSIPDEANLRQAQVLPDTFRLLVTHSAASNFTYSVGYVLLP